MKTFLSLLALFLLGCSSIHKSADGIDRSSGSYKIAKSLHGRDAKEEFEENRNTEELRFYAIGSPSDDEYVIPGITQEEVDVFIDEMDIGFDVISDFLNIHINTEGKSVSYLYSVVVREFAMEYNRLVLNEYKNRAYQGDAHNGDKRRVRS